MDVRTALAQLRSGRRDERDAAAAWVAQAPSVLEQVFDVVAAGAEEEAVHAAIFLREHLPAAYAAWGGAEQAAAVARCCSLVAAGCSKPLLAQLAVLIAALAAKACPPGARDAVLAALQALLAGPGSQGAGWAFLCGLLDTPAAPLRDGLLPSVVPQLLAAVRATSGAAVDPTLLEATERVLGVHDPHAGLWGGAAPAPPPAAAAGLAEACYEASSARGDVALLSAVAGLIPAPALAPAMEFVLAQLEGARDEETLRHAGLCVLRGLEGRAAAPPALVRRAFLALVPHADHEVCYTALARAAAAAEAPAPLLQEVLGRIEAAPAAPLLDALAAAADGAGDALRQVAPQAFPALVTLLNATRDADVREAAVECLGVLVAVYAHDDSTDDCYAALCSALPGLAAALLAPAHDAHLAARVAAVMEKVVAELTSEEAHQAARETFPPLLSALAPLGTPGAPPPRHLHSLLRAFGAVGYAARWYGGAGEGVAAALVAVLRGAPPEVAAAAMECAGGVVAVATEDGAGDYGLGAAAAPCVEAALGSDEPAVVRAGCVYAERVGMACGDDGAPLLNAAAAAAQRVLQNALDNPHPSRTASPDLLRAQLSAIDVLGAAASALSPPAYTPLLDPSASMLLSLLRARDPALRNASAFALERVARAQIAPAAPALPALIDAAAWFAQTAEAGPPQAAAAASAFAAGLLDSELVPEEHPAHAALTQAAG